MHRRRSHQVLRTDYLCVYRSALAQLLHGIGEYREDERRLNGNAVALGLFKDGADIERGIALRSEDERFGAEVVNAHSPLRLPHGNPQQSLFGLPFLAHDFQMSVQVEFQLRRLEWHNHQREPRTSSAADVVGSLAVENLGRLEAQARIR